MFEWTATSIATITQGIVSYVADGLEAHTAAGRPARVCVMPGTDVAWDNCECGQLALIVTNSYPSRKFPQAATDQWTPCHDLIIVVDCQLSLVRCVTGPTQGAEAPPCDSLTADFITQETDRYVAWSSLNCVLRSLAADGPGKVISDYIINDVPTLGPQGACGGIQINFKFSQYIPCEC